MKFLKTLVKMLIFDAAVLGLAVWMDSRQTVPQGAIGHPFPYITFMTGIALAVITAIVIAAAAVRAAAQRRG